MVKEKLSYTRAEGYRASECVALYVQNHGKRWNLVHMLLHTRQSSNAIQTNT